MEQQRRQRTHHQHQRQGAKRQHEARARRRFGKRQRRPAKKPEHHRSVGAGGGLEGGHRIVEAGEQYLRTGQLQECQCQHPLEQHTASAQDRLALRAAADGVRSFGTRHQMRSMKSAMPASARWPGGDLVDSISAAGCAGRLATRPDPLRSPWPGKGWPSAVSGGCRRAAPRW